MWQEFKAFAFKGNLIDVAVAFILGVAFSTVISATVKDLLTPLIGAVGGTQDFSTLAFHVNGSRFAYGDWLNAVIAFAITAAVLFVLVRGALHVQLLFAGDERPAPALRSCPFCLESINAAARRCPRCTSEVSPAEAV